MHIHLYLVDIVAVGYVADDDICVFVSADRAVRTQRNAAVHRCHVYSV